MLRDPDVYTDPDTCDPTRYAPSAKNPAGQPDPREVVWGFGKRYATYLSPSSETPSHC